MLRVALAIGLLAPALGFGASKVTQYFADQRKIEALVDRFDDGQPGMRGLLWGQAHCSHVKAPWQLTEVADRLAARHPNARKEAQDILAGAGIFAGLAAMAGCQVWEVVARKIEADWNDESSTLWNRRAGR